MVPHRAAADPLPFRVFALAVHVLWGEVITGRQFLPGLRPAPR